MFTFQPISSLETSDLGETLDDVWFYKDIPLINPEYTCCNFACCLFLWIPCLYRVAVGLRIQSDLDQLHCWVESMELRRGTSHRARSRKIEVEVISMLTFLDAGFPLLLWSQMFLEASVLLKYLLRHLNSEENWEVTVGFKFLKTYMFIWANILNLQRLQILRQKMVYLIMLIPKSFLRLKQSNERKT